MQRISLAPVLSATFSRDSCWIIILVASSSSALLGLLDDLGDPPALGRRQGPGLGQPDDVARAGGVLLVVGLEPGRPPDRLLVQAVLADVLHLDDHRLVHLVGDHDPGADLAAPAGLARGRRVLLGHWRSLSSARSRWCITVRTLAMSLRTSRSRCGLSSWPVTFWNRRLNSSSLASASLWAARRIASCAVASETPDSSNITRPGRTTATHHSGEPLPEPMRVSAGFLVTGLSGNRLTQTLPPRLMLRVIAIRAASIWRFVSQPASRVLRPYSPNSTFCWARDSPGLRPRCCRRYLTRLGDSISG